MERDTGPTTTRKGNLKMKNLYNIDITDENGMVSRMGIRANNKVEAITMSMERIRGWRNKDRIQNIEVIEDAGNRELTAEDYK